jgi:hypothetical protein
MVDPYIIMLSYQVGRFFLGVQFWPFLFFLSKQAAKEHVISRDSYTSYSIKYFCDVLKSMTVHQKEVIMNFGFGCPLLLEKCDIPSTFIRWIASCVDPVSHQIIVLDDSKVISISKDSVLYVVGFAKLRLSPCQTVMVVRSFYCLGLICR